LPRNDADEGAFPKGATEQRLDNPGAMMKTVLTIALTALTVAACGSEQDGASRQNGYVSGQLPTAAAVQEHATVDVGANHAPAVVRETSVGRRLAADGAVDPAERTDAFTPGEQIHLAVKVAPQSAAEGQLRVTWYGPGDDLLAEDAKPVPGSEQFVSFSSGDTASWNPGTYRAEVWLENEKLAEQRFALASREDLPGVRVGSGI
jgi:hypothetical protein